MSTSKMMAQGFAIDLSSFALGMWETARLLSRNPTRKKGQQKLELLRKNLDTFRERSVLSDSLRIHLKEEFRYEEFDSLLSKLEGENLKEIKSTIPDIEELIQKTQGCLNESGTAKTDFKRAL
jgi:hypothetical protein